MVKIFLLIIIFIVFLLAYSQVLEWKALYYPSKKIEIAPSDFGLEYEDALFKTKDGLMLHGWFIPAKDPFATILYCHGNAGNISHRVEIAKMFNQRGMDFFIFDYRGFGRSKGMPTEKGTYLDAEAAYDFLVNKKGVAKSRIVIYGKSIGASIAVDLAAKAPAAALISDSAFLSTRAMAREIYPFLPFWLFLRSKYNTAGKINKVDIPKLIIHSRNDEIVPFSHGQKLFELANPPKEFYEMRGGHNDAFYIYSDECLRRITDFLKRYLK